MANIDLHNHVVPPTIIDAIRKNPERFHTSIDDRDGKTYFNVHGDRKSTRLNSSHVSESRMPSSA